MDNKLEKYLEKANVLIEALPYIQRFNRKIIVVKYGGSAMADEELKKKVLDIELNHMSGINAFKPGYIDKENEVIVGLQTDAPLKRIINPYGGIRMVNTSLEAYDKKLNKNFSKASLLLKHLPNQ